MIETIILVMEGITLLVEITPCWLVDLLQPYLAYITFPFM